MPEFRALTFKKLADASEGIFTGLASTDDVDAVDDVILPSAYRPTIAKFNAGRLVLPVLADHDRQRQIGSVIALAEVPGGLEVVAQLALGLEDGRAALERMRAGPVGLSVGGIVKAAEPRGEGRTVTEFELLEVSVVALPANGAARVTAVKSRRDEEHALRQVLGLSSREAKAYVAAGRGALRQLPPEPTNDTAAALAAIQTFSKFLRGDTDDR